MLHLGCGNAKISGAVGVDMLRFPSVDVVHNLDSAPWPFENDTVDIFFVHSLLGHVTSIVDFFNEIRRVGKNGSRIIISVPYFRSVDAFSDPTMKHFFTSFSMDYFLDIGSHLSSYNYSSAKFKKIGFWYGWPQSSRNPFVRVFKAFIQRFPHFYDQYVSLLFPIKVLTWELEIKK